MRKRIVEAECLVEVVEPAGSDTFVVTRLGGQARSSRACAPTPRMSAGRARPFAFNMEKAVFFDPVSESRVA